MRRTDLQDTAPEMHRIRLELLRAKSPEWKLAKTLEMIEFSIQAFPEQTRRAVRAALRHP